MIVQLQIVADDFLIHSLQIVEDDFSDQKFLSYVIVSYLS